MNEPWEAKKGYTYGDGCDVLSSMVRIDAMKGDYNMPVSHSFNKIALSL